MAEGLLLGGLLILSGWLVPIGAAAALFVGHKAYTNPGTDWVTFKFAAAVFAAPWVLILMAAALTGLEGIGIMFRFLVWPYGYEGLPLLWLYHPALAVFVYWWWKMRNRPLPS